MAHRTRKKLTKTELKKDPVNEALLKSMAYLQDHVKQFIIAGVLLIVGVLVVQSLSGNARRQADEARAQFFLASQIYNMGLDNLVRYGNIEVAVSQLQSAQQLSRNNYRSYPGRLAGRRSEIIAAKVGIIFRMESEVITELQDLLATNPGRDIENPASLHLAIALENRGGANDLANARELYNNILQSVPANSQLAWEAHSGLSRIDYMMENYEESLDHLNTALEISGDTTDYVEYQLTRLNMAMN
jgi:tetratricopeptide (TPR) repeat protein